MSQDRYLCTNLKLTVDNWWLMLLRHIMHVKAAAMADLGVAGIAMAVAISKLHTRGNSNGGEGVPQCVGGRRCQ